MTSMLQFEQIEEGKPWYAVCEIDQLFPPEARAQALFERGLFIAGKPNHWARHLGANRRSGNGMMPHDSPSLFEALPGPSG